MEHSARLRESMGRIQEVDATTALEADYCLGERKLTMQSMRVALHATVPKILEDLLAQAISPVQVTFERPADTGPMQLIGEWKMRQKAYHLATRTHNLSTDADFSIVMAVEVEHDADHWTIHPVLSLITDGDGATLSGEGLPVTPPQLLRLITTSQNPLIDWLIMATCAEQNAEAILFRMIELLLKRIWDRLIFEDRLVA